MLKRMRTYLGVIFAIFARDVKRVLRNPSRSVIALGMIVMPSAYARYVVMANWDPLQQHHRHVGSRGQRGRWRRQP